MMLCAACKGHFPFHCEGKPVSLGKPLVPGGLNEREMSKLTHGERIYTHTTHQVITVPLFSLTTSIPIAKQLASIKGKETHSLPLGVQVFRDHSRSAVNAGDLAELRRLRRPSDSARWESLLGSHVMCSCVDLCLLLCLPSR